MALNQTMVPNPSVAVNSDNTEDNFAGKLSKITEVILHGNDKLNTSYGYRDNSTFMNETGSETMSHGPTEYNYYINGVVTNIIVVLGLIGNFLTIIILSQRAMRSSTNMYLSALAWWDAVVLVSTALLIGLPTVWSTYNHYVYAYVVSYIYPLALIAQTATIWLTVSFTVERYIAVCHPLKAARMCTIWRAKIVIICVSVCSSLYNVPRWFDYRPKKVHDPSLNATVVKVDTTSFSVNPTYVQIYFSWLYVPIMCVIPLFGLFVLNLFLILAVRKSQRQRKDMNVKQSRENNVTIMLVSVVIVFIICQVPALVYNIAYAIDRNYVTTDSSYQILSTLRNCLVTFNSAINFLLYCALGQKFRRIFLHTFCRRCVKESYMPMSGVYQHTTMVSIPSTRNRQFNNRLINTRGKISTDTTNHTSSSTNQVTGSSSQESSLISPTSMSPGRVKSDRQVHIYTAPKLNMNMAISKNGGECSGNNSRCGNNGKASIMGKSANIDSDDDPNYDVALESLLPEREEMTYTSYKPDHLGRINKTMAL